MAFLECLHLTRNYGKGAVTVTAVQDVSLQVEKGEFLCLTGRSGSGKTTLLHLLGALESPSTGAVYLDGREITRFSPRMKSHLLRTRVSFVFQSLNLITSLTILENTVLPLRYSRVKRMERIEKGRKVLQEVGLGKRLGAYPSELSGGEMQRVAVARALAKCSDLLLADEPTGELDTATAREITDLLLEVNRVHGTTVVVASHDPYVVGKAARVVELRDGKIS
ncbi:MAG: ABC transporter ATP-binding protein [Armatimonadetes bacterium]|nr:ABC transporter ATP-binding protein [Armatimonadota bacterium]